MKTIARITSILVCLILLSSCTQSVDYQLEKDNFRNEVITTTLDVKEDGTAFEDWEIYEMQDKVTTTTLYYKEIPFTGEVILRDEYHPSQKTKSTGKYKAGKKDGTHTFYKDNRLRNVINYKNGIKEGLYVEYYKNGQVAEWNFKDGEEDGLHRAWYENGQLTAEMNYKDGEVDGLWRTWHENGQLKEDLNFKFDGLTGPDDELYGLNRRWYENGQLKSVTNYGENMETLFEKKYDTVGTLAYDYKSPNLKKYCKKVAMDYLLKLDLSDILWLNDEGYVGGVCRGKPNQYCGRVQKFHNGQYWTYDIVVFVEKNEFGECKVTGTWDNL